NKRPSVPGLNVQAEVRDDAGTVIGQVALRDLVVTYEDIEGFPAGSDAPVQVTIFNETPRPVRVRVTSPAAQPGEEGTIGARSVELTSAAGSPTASPPVPGSPPATGTPAPTGTPTGSPAPTGTPTGQPAPPTGQPAPTAVIEIPPAGFAVLGPDSERQLRLIGLDGRLTAGSAARLLFEFDNGAVLRVAAPVGTPLSPAPRATPETEEQSGH
ncbi:MAG TPA: hypothetical protein VFR67_09070, partial [Pilimelia sp.]|nr:hypothetical protein [Pilimelia sp.]